MKASTTQTNRRSFRTLVRVLVINVIGLSLLLGIEATIIIPQSDSKPTTHTLTPKVISSVQQAKVVTLGQQYMNALLQQKYTVMWSMLHPQIQATWPDQGTFGRYLQMRFGNYTLQSFSLGKAGQLSSWINPETMIQYNDVETVPISLQLVSRLTPQQQVPLAPQFQHPEQIMQNIPFIVQRVQQSNGVNDQWFVLNGGPADPEAPILPPLTPASRTVAVPILMYHYISGVPANDPNPVLRQSLSVSPDLFNQQLDYLKQQNFHSITLNQLMNALYYGLALPSKPLILTFDDGYLDGYTAAYPALKAHGFSGVFYIITGRVGWPGQMSWDHLREMLSNGMQMGSHTVNHRDMGDTYLASVDLANQEAQISQKDLQDHLGISIQHFCYPNGGPFKGNNITLQQKVVALLAANGYIDATTDPGSTGVIQSSLNPLALLRLRIDGRSSIQSFIHTLQSYA